MGTPSQYVGTPGDDNTNHNGDANGIDITNEILSDVQICQEFGLKDVGYEGGFDFGSHVQTSADISATPPTHHPLRHPDAR